MSAGLLEGEEAPALEEERRRPPVQGEAFQHEGPAEEEQVPEGAGHAEVRPVHDKTRNSPHEKPCGEEYGKIRVHEHNYYPTGEQSGTGNDSGRLREARRSGKGSRPAGPPEPPSRRGGGGTPAEPFRIVRRDPEKVVGTGIALPSL